MTIMPALQMRNDVVVDSGPLDVHFRWLGRPYYLALQTAAASHGSSRQAIQVTQVRLIFRIATFASEGFGSTSFLSPRLLLA